VSKVRPYEPFGSTTREGDGLTVFASDGQGHTRAIVRAGMPLGEALREVCLQLDEWPGEWRIDCISTPTTIYRDLQGRREKGKRPNRRYYGDNVTSERAEFPEYRMLGNVGRVDLFRDPA
jgi:hypothetical protein